MGWTHHYEFNGDGDATLVLDPLVDLDLDEIEDDDADESDHQLRDVGLWDVGQDCSVRLQ